MATAPVTAPTPVDTGPDAGERPALVVVLGRDTAHVGLPVFRPDGVAGVGPIGLETARPVRPGRTLLGPVAPPFSVAVGRALVGVGAKQTPLAAVAGPGVARDVAVGPRPGPVARFFIVPGRPVRAAEPGLALPQEGPNIAVTPKVAPDGVNRVTSQLSLVGDGLERPRVGINVAHHRVVPDVEVIVVEVVDAGHNTGTGVTQATLPFRLPTVEVVDVGVLAVALRDDEAYDTAFQAVDGPRVRHPVPVRPFSPGVTGLVGVYDNAVAIALAGVVVVGQVGVFDRPKGGGRPSGPVPPQVGRRRRLGVVVPNGEGTGRLAPAPETVVLLALALL